MMKKKIYPAILLCVCLLQGITAFATGTTDDNTPNYKFKKVYFLGVAKNYQDSVTVFTDIMTVDHIAIDPKSGDVANQEQYTSQLANYFLKNGRQGYICATFMTYDAKSMEKLYLRLKKRVAKESMTHLEELAIGSFTYKAVDPSTIYRNAPAQPVEGDETESNNQE